jgi:hypothetical protein
MSIGESSSLPDSGTKERITPKKKLPEELDLEATIEHDVFVHLPPKRRYLVEVDVKRIRKAEPNIVVPEL